MAFKYPRLPRCSHLPAKGNKQEFIQDCLLGGWRGRGVMCIKNTNLECRFCFPCESIRASFVDCESVTHTYGRVRLYFFPYNILNSARRKTLGEESIF